MGAGKGNRNRRTTHFAIAASVLMVLSALVVLGAGAASSHELGTPQETSRLTPASSPPGAPTGLNATARSTSEIDLVWTNPIATLTDDYVYEYSTGCGALLNTYNLGSVTTQYFATSLAPATTYCFTVAAATSGGTGPASVSSWGTTAPLAPTGMTVMGVTTSSVWLNWTNPAGNISWTYVNRFPWTGTSCGPLAYTYNLTGVYSSYVVTSLAPSTTYCFISAASVSEDAETVGYTGALFGAYSSYVETTTLNGVPAAPTNVTATAVSESQINVSWTNPTGNLTNIFLKEYRGFFCSGNGSVYITTYSWGYPLTNFTVTGLLSATAYAFTVAAETNGGLGPASYCHSATTFSASPPGPAAGTPAINALFAVYNNRTDLQAAFPDAANSSASFVGLLDWAGGVTIREIPDSSNATLAPFGYFYALMLVYNGRADLQSIYPGVTTDLRTHGNSTEYAQLVNWAGGVVLGQWTDSASPPLDAFGYYYTLLKVYDGRSDLQGAFPDALGNQSTYVSLVNWAGSVVTGQWTDSANATLQGFGYYYALMKVYNGRADLQSAFPNAFTNEGSYQALLTWAKDVVTGAITDSASPTLMPFASSYIALAPSGSSPIGSAFIAGNPIAGTCLANDTFAAQGCKGGDHIYTLTVESSTVTFANVLFEVKTAVGGPYGHNGSGGFSVIRISGTVAAQTPIPGGSGMEMTSTFATYGSGIWPSTALTSVYTIVLDMGTVNTVGLGLTFVVTGTGGFDGTTSPVTLP